MSSQPVSLSWEDALGSVRALPGKRDSLRWVKTLDETRSKDGLENERRFALERVRKAKLLNERLLCKASEQGA